MDNLCKHCRKPLGCGRDDRLYCDKICQRRAIDKRRAPRRILKRDYDITWGVFQALLTTQKGKCAICHEKPLRPLHVDVAPDDRKRVRGLLCHRCKLEGVTIDRSMRRPGFANYPW